MRTNPRGTSFEAAELEAISAIFVKLALKAGQRIMEIRAGGPHVRRKADDSPVCEADEQAEAIILAGLGAEMPDLTIVAEEAAAAGPVPRLGKQFILVDPLDGTREFIANRDQFTVNIALISGHEPVLGVVYAPAQERIWCGGRGLSGQAFAQLAKVPVGGDAIDEHEWQPMHARAAGGDGLTVLCSMSHLDPDTEAFIQKLDVAERREIGSSSKFCLIAAGEADVYPRLSPTMEWDIAAGDAILRAAGGTVLAMDGKPMRYGKPAFRNAGFFAWGDLSAAHKM